MYVYCCRVIRWSGQLDGVCILVVLGKKVCVSMNLYCYPAVGIELFRYDFDLLAFAFYFVYIDCVFVAFDCKWFTFSFFVG